MTDMAAAARPAFEVYEVLLEDPSSPKSWLQTAGSRLVGLLTMRSTSMDPGGMIISVRRIGDGEELFRHIEDLADDDGHLLDGIKDDLASMTAAEFKTRWID